MRLFSDLPCVSIYLFIHSLIYLTFVGLGEDFIEINIMLLLTNTDCTHPATHIIQNITNEEEEEGKNVLTDRK